MSLNILIAFWGVSILFVMTPGIDWAYAISSGIQGKRVLPAVTGLLTGHLMAALIVAAGVGTLVASQPVLLQVLTGVGAVYLLWMGLSLSMRPATISSDQVVLASSKSWYIRGVYLSGLNPKVLLLFLALLPPFIDPQAALSPTSQIVLLAGIHLMSCAAVYFLVGFSAQKVLGTRPQAARVVSRVSGALMMLIAIILLLEQFYF